MKKQLTIFENDMKNIKTCAFTGHRILEEDFSLKKLKAAIKEVILRGVDTFLVGMAMGFDLYAAETVLSLKRKFPHVKLVACIPCYHQEKNFSLKDKKRYAKILKKVDEQVLVSEEYYSGCMQKRDRYMADKADILIAYLKKETGGTAFTVKYFQKKYPLKEKILL